RIPCTELLRIANAAGWDFSSSTSLQLLDLQSAMRQGGLDGFLTIWGRMKKWDVDELMRDEVLQKIPASHWADNFVHLFAAQEGDNFNVYSWKMEKAIAYKGYIDLHVERSEAENCIAQYASSFKGRTVR